MPHLGAVIPNLSFAADAHYHHSSIARTFRFPPEQRRAARLVWDAAVYNGEDFGTDEQEKLMTTSKYQIAQVNIGRMLAPLEDPIMAEFVASLGEINALADSSPGFVWRFQTEEGDATAIRPYDDDRIIVNFSVWETVEDLKTYVYQSAHAQVMRRRRQWFEKFEGMYMALWWVEAGHLPSVSEAKERLEDLSRHGESERAFTFRRLFGPPDQAADELIAMPFDPCPAT